MYGFLPVNPLYTDSCPLALLPVNPLYDIQCFVIGAREESQENNNKNVLKGLKPTLSNIPKIDKEEFF